MSLQNALVVYKNTAYNIFVNEQGDKRIKSLIKQKNESVKELELGNKEHCDTLDKVKFLLHEFRIKYKSTTRVNIPDTSAYDLIITVGGDGTLLDAVRHVKNTPILGVNSSLTYSKGFFCCANINNFADKLDMAINGQLSAVTVHRLQALLNGKELAELALNDILFSNEIPSVASRYIIKIGSKKEEHISSGVWISTAAGSTAAARAAGGTVLPIRSRKIQFVTRELHKFGGNKFDLQKGVLDGTSSVILIPKMRYGKIYIDGHHISYNASFGDEIEIKRAKTPATILGINGNTH